MSVSYLRWVNLISTVFADVPISNNNRPKTCTLLATKLVTRFLTSSLLLVIQNTFRWSTVINKNGSQIFKISPWPPFAFVLIGDHFLSHTSTVCSAIMQPSPSHSHVLDADWTSCRRILWSFEAVRFALIGMQFTGILTGLLLHRLSNTKTIC